jgi:hypothetical protein
LQGGWMGGRVDGWMGGWVDEKIATRMLRPRLVGDRSKFHSSDQIAIDAIYWQ